MKLYITIHLLPISLQNSINLLCAQCAALSRWNELSTTLIILIRALSFHLLINHWLQWANNSLPIFSKDAHYNHFGTAHKQIVNTSFATTFVQSSTAHLSKLLDIRKGECRPFDAVCQVLTRRCFLLFIEQCLLHICLFCDKKRLRGRVDDDQF